MADATQSPEAAGTFDLQAFLNSGSEQRFKLMPTLEALGFIPEDRRSDVQDLYDLRDLAGLAKISGNADYQAVRAAFVEQVVTPVLTALQYKDMFSQQQTAVSQRLEAISAELGEARWYQFMKKRSLNQERSQYEAARDQLAGQSKELDGQIEALASTTTDYLVQIQNLRAGQHLKGLHAALQQAGDLSARHPETDGQRPEEAAAAIAGWVHQAHYHLRKLSAIGYGPSPEEVQGLEELTLASVAALAKDLPADASVESLPRNNHPASRLASIEAHRNRHSHWLEEHPGIFANAPRSLADIAGDVGVLRSVPDPATGKTTGFDKAQTEAAFNMTSLLNAAGIFHQIGTGQFPAEMRRIVTEPLRIPVVDQVNEAIALVAGIRINDHGDQAMRAADCATLSEITLGLAAASIAEGPMKDDPRGKAVLQSVQERFAGRELPALAQGQEMLASFTARMAGRFVADELEPLLAADQNPVTPAGLETALADLRTADTLKADRIALVIDKAARVAARGAEPQTGTREQLLQAAASILTEKRIEAEAATKAAEQPAAPKAAEPAADGQTVETATQPAPAAAADATPAEAFAGQQTAATGVTITPVAVPDAETAAPAATPPAPVPLTQRVQPSASYAEQVTQEREESAVMAKA